MPILVMNPAAKIPAAAINTGTRTLSTASRQPSSFGITLHARLEKAVSWLQARQPRRVTFLQQQQQQQQQINAALFSTSGSAARSFSKEEDDLYQALTASFRTRLAEQIHKPEDEYKAVIEHWTAHTQKDALTRQRTRARKDRLAAAAKHKDITWIQKEQDKLELEANGTSDDYFYVIQAWIKCGELKRATMAFEKMESIGVPLTVRMLAAMTRAHTRSGNLAIAGAMVQKIRDQNLQPTSIYDLSALLEYYIKMTSPPPSTPAAELHVIEAHRKSDCSREPVENIWKVIEPRLQLGISATVNSNASFSYRTYLVFLVERAHDFERAAELIEKMTARNISPELEKYQKTADVVIRRLASHGYLTEVQKLLDQNDAKLAKLLPQLTWSEIMEAYMSRGEDQKARWIYHDMIRYGVQPNSQCKKLFSDLQLKGGTTDFRDPETLNRGDREGVGKEEANILSILFNRQPKPTLSS
ncbi:hypothetical protein BGX21_005406 [Mortierella sp. AD011]|nr:hypothetical protein BGX20_005513 [Mortierella sp. AD010]KAF9399901.1 hypothetical protein BGX21_005406 [Mortierella sp. AD011]